MVNNVNPLLENRIAFVEAQTNVLTPALTPELRFRGVDEETALWAATEAMLDQAQLPPPFWAFAWPGGQALARLLLDEPRHVRGKSVVALAAGAGLEAIAAAQAGAARAIANDVDPLACVAATLNAELNGVAVETETCDALSEDGAGASSLLNADIILIGDAFYERRLTERFLKLIDGAARRGATVLIGDAGRAGSSAEHFFSKCELLLSATIATNVEIEGEAERRARVFRRGPATLSSA